MSINNAMREKCVKDIKKDEKIIKFIPPSSDFFPQEILVSLTIVAQFIASSWKTWINDIFTPSLPRSFKKRWFGFSARRKQAQKRRSFCYYFLNSLWKRSLLFHAISCEECIFFYSYSMGKRDLTPDWNWKQMRTILDSKFEYCTFCYMSYKTTKFQIPKSKKKTCSIKILPSTLRIKYERHISNIPPEATRLSPYFLLMIRIDSKPRW